MMSFLDEYNYYALMMSLEKEKRKQEEKELFLKEIRDRLKSLDDRLSALENKLEGNSK